MKLIFAVLLAFTLTAAKTEKSYQSFSRPAYYTILKSGKVNEINDELALVQNAAVSEKEAYEGTLLMRKAGLAKLPSEKLKLFKRGRIKLETAILNNEQNGEYHFLRLIIEEYAPKIVKYNKDIETDKDYIKKTFKELSPAVQQAIIDYSKNSTVLHRQDLQ